MNYYQILQVPENASQKEIRDSYIRLIKKYHPDIYTGTVEYGENVTKELNDAYDVLSDEDKRRQYDLELHPPEPYAESYNNFNEASTNVDIEYEAPEETFEQKMKETIHKIVDEKTETMSSHEKKMTVLIIIIVALLLTIFCILDYINLLNKMLEKEEEKNNVNTQVVEYMENYF